MTEEQSARSNAESGTAVHRVPPLNLTEEESEYLWEMLKREIGKDEVWDGDDTEQVRSLHTKVRNLVVDDAE